MTIAELIQSEKPVLVDFFATWCGPCKMMSPILEEVKEAIGDQARIVKVDVDKYPQAAQEHGIQGVPTFILYQKGKALWRQSGVVSKQQLIQTIQNFI